MIGACQWSGVAGEDHIDIRALQHVLVMGVGLYSRSLLRGHAESLLVDVKQRATISISGLFCRYDVRAQGKVAAAPGAQADYSHIDVIVRAHYPDQAGRAAKAAVTRPVLFSETPARGEEPEWVASLSAAMRRESKLTEHLQIPPDVGLLLKGALVAVAITLRLCHALL